MTLHLVKASTVAFILLLLPQLWKNGIALAAGNAAALAGLSWEGFGTALMGNTQLLGYFIEREEPQAALIQGIGVVSNYAVLFQLSLAGHLPSGMIPLLVVAALCTGAVIACRLLAWQHQFAAQLWRSWQAFTAIAGIVVVPQALAAAFFGVTSLWPASLATAPAAALLVLDATGRLSGRLANLWSILSAWSATLLFCCQPIAQLARNLASPESISSLSLATVLLAMTGNALMMPRAFLTRDLVWSVGSAWGCTLMGWGNLLCLAMASASGAASFSWQHFQMASSALLVYVVATATMQLRAQRAQALIKSA